MRPKSSKSLQHESIELNVKMIQMLAGMFSVSLYEKGSSR